MIILQNSKLESIAVIKNAYNVSCNLNRSGLDFLQFSVPYTDPILKDISFGSFIQATEPNPKGNIKNAVIGTYRVRQRIAERAVGDERVDFYCESGLTTLTENIVPYHFFNDTDAVWSIIEALLEFQSTRYWDLGEYELEGDERQLTFDWEKVSVLEAILSIQDLLRDEYYFKPNYTTSPWTLDLLKTKDPEYNETSFAAVEGNNLISYRKTLDTQDMATRLYVFGKNGVGIQDHTPNREPYLTKNIDKYGDIVKVYENSDSNQSWWLALEGERILDEISEPLPVYDINVTSEYANTHISELRPGDLLHFISKEDSVIKQVEKINRDLDTGINNIVIGKTIEEVTKRKITERGGTLS